MKKLAFLILALCITSQGYSWGKTGHRVVGQVAEKYLTKKARKSVKDILGGETLAEVGDYMDFIRSDSTYDHMTPWHYCTIPDGLTYEEAGTPSEGDVIVTIKRLMKELRTKNFTDGDEAFALKCLVHLVGDIHQPLHVGNGEDKGGNDVKVEYFWSRSNLHRVWDSEIIDGQQYSYTEYTQWIDRIDKKTISGWQNAEVVNWAYESMECRDQVYRFSESNKLSYDYVFKNLSLVNTRLLQAGARLAGILNEIYG